MATNGRRKVLLNVLDGCVGCQHLGKLLSCLWTELVLSKTAKKEAGRQCQQKFKIHFVNDPGVKKEMMFWQRMEGGRSYLMFWMVSFVASTLASSFPASGPSLLYPRLYEGR